MDQGYVKLWRRSLTAGWIRNKNRWAFWSYCLLKATHKDIIQIVGNQQITLHPGQFIFGRKRASIDLDMTEREIRTCFQSLFNMKNLTIKTTNKFSIITIVNWDIYQSSENGNDHQSVKQSVQYAPALDHKQEHKNINTKNKTIEYTMDFESFWKEYPKKIGKGDAFKSWNKNGRPPLEKIIKSIRDQKESDQWRKDGGQYIPMPATWINQKRWDDEPFKPNRKDEDPWERRKRLKNLSESAVNSSNTDIQEMKS